jgi:hypothetical protein
MRVGEYGATPCHQYRRANGQVQMCGEDGARLVSLSSEYGSSSVDSWRDTVLWSMVDATNAVGNIRIAHREEKQRDR